MIRHSVQMIAATLLIAACMFLPFLPGEYDGLAMPLSFMAQLFATAGLLLVPIGASWLVYELGYRRRKGGNRPGKDLGYWFGLAAIAASTPFVTLVCLAAFFSVGPSLGFAAVALWAYCAWRLTRKLKAVTASEVRAFNPAPLYLVVLPIVAATLKFTLVSPAAEFSRNRAIDNSAELISDIERFRDVHGHYPRSLQSLHDDYEPRVIGVKQYHYEPSGDGYNVYFEHYAVEIDIREIVMFNRRGEHEFTSHNADLLQYTPAQLARSRGYVAVHDASRPHWKCFLFD